MRLCTACLVGMAAVFSGCVHAPREDRHAALIESTALGLSGPAAPIAADPWWRAFGDPQLDRLIELALARNPGLDQALARVRAASAELLASGAARRPELTFEAEQTWQRFSEHYYIPPPFAGGRYWAGMAAANLSWTLEFWGRQAAAIEQAHAAGMATQLDVQAARLAVSGALVQAYLDLHRAYSLIDIASRTLGQRENLAGLVEQRLGAGLETAIELNIARARVASARNVLERAGNARELAVHRLAALCGRGADFYAQIGRPTLVLEGALPLPESLPIDLLVRRPDVLAARARVAAADAGRVAARAAFYPELSLRAFAGSQAIGLDTLLNSGSAVYGGGPTLRLPVFDAGRLRAAYRRSTAELDAAVAGYNGVVLRAVSEAADQLSLVDSLTQQAGEAHRRRAAALAAHELARQRYHAGLVTQLVVLEAEDEILAAQQEIAMLESARTMARITLFLTLGGSVHDRTR